MLKPLVPAILVLLPLHSCHVSAGEKKPLVSVCNMETSGLTLPDAAIERLSDRLAARLSATGKVQVVDRKLTNAHGRPDPGRDLYMTSQDQGCLASFMAARGHVLFMKRAAVFDDYLEVRDRLLETPEVASVIPFVINEAVVSNETGFSSVVLEGVHPPTIGFLAGLQTRKKTSLPGLYIGRELAHRLNVREGERVHLISPLNMKKAADGVHPKTKSFAIAGIFYTGMYETDDKMAFTTLEDTQRFFEMEKGVTGLRVDFDDIADTGRLSEKLIGELDGHPYFCMTWLQMNRNLFQALSAHPVGKNTLSDLVVISQVRRRGTRCKLNAAMFDRKNVRITRSVVVKTACSEQGIAKGLDYVAKQF